MFVLRWRHLLLGWRKSADFPVSPNAVAPQTNALNKRVKRLLTWETFADQWGVESILDIL
jgi:hypothetical protein